MVMRYLGGVNSPSYNPLASNVTTGVTTVQNGGVYTTTSAAQALSNSQWVYDPYFKNNVMLLQADNAANGYQNNTFLDASENNLAVFRSGNATQGTFSPFSQAPGYWGNFFDGTGDYLSIPDSATLELGTSNFCFECFFYATTVSATGSILQKRSGTTVPPIILWRSTSSVQVYMSSSTQGDMVNGTSLGNIAINQWYHVAVYRIGTAIYGSLNGVITTLNASTALSVLDNAIPYTIGMNGNGTSDPWTGWITNARLVIGDSVYTSTSAPVPTSPLTPIPSTQLLTVQDNRPLDNSVNEFTVTSFGNTAARPFTPFYNPQFSSYNNLTPSYGSAYFDGGAQLKFVGSTISATTSTFTIECWVNATQWSYDSNGWIFIEGSDATYYLQFGPGSNGVLTLSWLPSGGGTLDIDGTAVIQKNVWNHIAVSVNSNSVSFYVNGVLDPISSVTTTLTNRSAVGNQGFIGGITSNGYRGGISNLSVLSGVAKYSGPTITVPTAPLPTSATGQVLLFARDGLYDSNTTVAAKPITLYSGSVIEAPSSPFGAAAFAYPSAPGSMFFDGTGDYLNLGGPSQLAFGTNDFTIECWVYLNALPVPPAGSFLYDSRPASTDGAYPCIFVAPTTNVLTYYVSTAARITGTTAIKLGQWNYVVVSRVSGSTRMFLNGAQEGSTYTDSTTYLNGANRPVIANNGLNLGGAVTGYISNLRVLNGTGSTTSTVPTAPLTAVANTDLLLNGTNAGIYDATERSVLETVGNAQVSTNIKKYGSGSMSFDGTGDYLTVPHSPDLNLGTSDFTVEAWVNLTNTSASRSLIGKGTASTGWGIYFNAQPTLFIFNYAGSIAYSSNYNLIEGQWYHLAVTRAGTGSNNFRMFINGTLILEATVTTDLSTTSNMYVGANRVAAVPMFGYVDDLRITNGYARYTASFIPPAVGFFRQGPIQP